MGINQGDVVELLARVAPAVNLYLFYTILKHQFQRSFRIIFLQITLHIYFKITRVRPLRATNLHIPNHTSAYRWPNGGLAWARYARRPWAATPTQARHTGLLTVLDRPVSLLGHLVKSA